MKERLKNKRYRAKLVRRRYLPKSPAKQRQLGIPALEDKLVQRAARSILEADCPIVVSETIVMVVIERGKNMEFRNHTHLADRNKRLIDTVVCVNYNTWQQI